MTDHRTLTVRWSESLRGREWVWHLLPPRRRALLAGDGTVGQRCQLRNSPVPAVIMVPGIARSRWSRRCGGPSRRTRARRCSVQACLQFRTPPAVVGIGQGPRYRRSSAHTTLPLPSGSLPHALATRATRARPRPDGLVGGGSSTTGSNIGWVSRNEMRTHRCGRAARGAAGNDRTSACRWPRRARRRRNAGYRPRRRRRHPPRRSKRTTARTGPHARSGSTGLRARSQRRHCPPPTATRPSRRTP